MSWLSTYPMIFTDAAADFGGSLVSISEFTLSAFSSLQSISNVTLTAPSPLSRDRQYREHTPTLYVAA